eukprot:TRINITY_DN5196_c0_g1_i1.p1 TRINITY_DN5196_c0_g1~~TRINITY_DN5196_c0_g1_i1.p1  ORF type:complete len:240 (-),score=16.77 TRINITY_DN5196_c0_g1_i1:97-816(-)
MKQTSKRLHIMKICTLLFVAILLPIESFASDNSRPEPQLPTSLSAKISAQLPFWLGTGSNMTGRWRSDIKSGFERLSLHDDDQNIVFDTLASCDDSSSVPFRVTKACTTGGASCVCRRVKECSTLDLSILNQIKGALLRQDVCDDSNTCSVWTKSFPNWEIELSFADGSNELRSFNVKNLWEVKFERDDSPLALSVTEAPCEVESSSDTRKPHESVAVDVLFPLREAVRVAKSHLRSRS